MDKFLKYLDELNRIRIEYKYSLDEVYLTLNSWINENL